MELDYVVICNFLTPEIEIVVVGGSSLGFQQDKVIIDLEGWIYLFI